MGGKHGLGTWVVVLFLALSVGTAFGQSCGCEVSDRKETAYNALLVLDEEERQEAISVHLPWGIPTRPPNASNESLLVQDEYVINYDADLRVPTWVAYRLREIDLRDTRERTECFRLDPRISQNDAAVCSDYDEPVYDRGHMAPNADMVRSEAAMVNTYMFTNMAPQHDRFNRGVWSRFESFVRDWARGKGIVYVITGAVFDKNDDGSRDLDTDADRMASNNAQARVAVPTDFYKIILHERPNGFIENLTILLPHLDENVGATKPYLKSHITTIDAVEELTGIDFLAALKAEDPSKERAVEQHKAKRLWSTE